MIAKITNIFFVIIFELQNYNSIEKSKKKYNLESEKGFQIHLGTSHEERNLILDLVINNYLKCMGTLCINYGRSKEKKRFRNFT